MENNPFSRERGDEGPNQETLLLRNIWLPQFTETRELVQSTKSFLRVTPEEGRQRNIRLEVTEDLETRVMSAVLRPRMPVSADELDIMCRVIQDQHQDITKTRQKAIANSAIRANAEKLAQGSGAAYDMTETYFSKRPMSVLEEKVMNGLSAQFAISQAMLGLEQYLNHNLDGESAAEKILGRVSLAVMALREVQNRSPLRFILRDIQLYKRDIIVLNTQIAELAGNEDYENIIRLDKELQRILLQLKSYIQ